MGVVTLAGDINIIRDDEIPFRARNGGKKQTVRIFSLSLLSPIRTIKLFLVKCRRGITLTSLISRHGFYGYF